MTQNKDALVFDLLMEETRFQASRMALAAMLGTTPDFNLACVGTSIYGLGALTVEALAYLICADVVYCYPASAQHYKLITLLNENVINLHDTLYARGNEFDPSYDAIIKEVMHAVRGGTRVTYATQGSPAFHCGTAASLHRRAKQEGFSSIVVGGVSSFELLSADLAGDYDLTNIQLYSVLALAKNAVRLDPGVPCLLFDFGRYALPAIREDSSKLQRSKVAALAHVIQRSYPTHHEVVLMSVRNNGRYSRLRTTTCETEEALLSFGEAVTIFIPAVGSL